MCGRLAFIVGGEVTIQQLTEINNTLFTEVLSKGTKAELQQVMEGLSVMLRSIDQRITQEQYSSHAMQNAYNPYPPSPEEAKH